MIKKDLLKLDIQLFAVQTTTLAAEGNNLSAEMKTYYEKTLLDSAEPKLVHDQFADKYPIPANAGKTIEFRKYDSLGKALTPLTEGVTPAGNRLNVTAITATINQYGDFITLSDMLKMTAIDNNIVQATKLLGSQSGRTLDSVTRDVLVGGTNVAYAPTVSGQTETAVTSRYGLDATAKITPELVTRAAVFLEGMNADTIGEDYISIIHPHIGFDIQRNSEWLAAHQYATPENIYNGELGKIGNVRFIKSTESKVWRGANLTVASRTLSVKTAITGTAAATIAVKEAISAAEATALAGRKVLISGVQYTVVSASNAAAGSAIITIDTAILVAADVVLYPGEAGAGGISIYSAIVLGAHAYAVTEVEGMGLQHIVKPLGYADELNQKASVGWKATKAAKRLVEQYMVRLEVASGFSTTTAEN